jgi:hypothetical protein
MMMSPHPAAPVLTERTRLAACLLHALPAAVGVIEMRHGERYLVAHHRHDALLTPCELRTSLLQPVVAGVPHLAGMVRSIELVGGAVDAGGGLYRPSHPSCVDERWFVTSLDPDRVTSTAADCPDSIDHRDVSVRVSADVELGASAVCVHGDPATSAQVDDVARWLHRRCLVDELIEPLCTSRAV